MRKAGILFLGLLVLVLFAYCAKKPPVVDEKPPVVKEEPKPEEEAKPEIPKEEVTKKVITQEDFQPLYFDFDKYDLRPGDREKLNQNAQVLKENPTVIIKIEGNCDERGTVEYNLALGENRARAAKDYLVKLGIDANRISIHTWGKEKAKHCTNDDCWSEDRRDDFMITSQ